MVKKGLFYIRNFYFQFLHWILFHFKFRRIFKNSDLPSNLLKSYCSQRSNKSNKSLCNAPFSSFYLGLDGYVTPCCFNRKIKFGKYNSQLFHEIWNGKIMNEFRKELMNYKFPEGCTKCKDHFLNSNFKAMGALNYDNLPGLPEQPSQLIFELSNKCNYQCIMCKGSDYDWLSIIEQNRTENTNYTFLFNQLDSVIPKLYEAKFLGGEPFLIESYYNIFERIISLNPNCILDVQTNGSILDDRLKKIMEKGRFRIGTSLDSLNAETFGNIRKGGDLKDVLGNIDYFFNYTRRKNTSLYFAICLMTVNWEGIPDIINFCNSYNAHVFFNTVMTPQHLSLFCLPPEKLEPIISYLENAKLRAANYIENSNKIAYLEYVAELRTWYQYEVKLNKINRDNMDELEGIPLSEILNELKSKYQRAFISNEYQNINMQNRYSLISEKLLETFPDDIYFKKMLRSTINMPDEEFKKGISKKNIDELLSISKQEYSRIKTSYTR